MDEVNKQVDIQEVNGRTQITFKKAILKGKVSKGQLIDTILMAAQMHAETLVKKLSRGAPLDPSDVKALKELAEIAKIEVQELQQQPVLQPVQELSLKMLSTQIYEKLTESKKDNQ